jgi:hypothetical protein
MLKFQSEIQPVVGLYTLTIPVKQCIRSIYTLLYSIRLAALALVQLVESAVALRVAIFLGTLT